mmetsp:Transcript_19510/g.28896  ORF Transcript_19510/g.28896 Transcript_19510/m.28896 type:complete len:151 (-) Transcript_19510:95-547(-)
MKNSDFDHIANESPHNSENVKMYALKLFKRYASIATKFIDEGNFILFRLKFSKPEALNAPYALKLISYIYESKSALKALSMLQSGKIIDPIIIRNVEMSLSKISDSYIALFKAAKKRKRLILSCIGNGEAHNGTSNFQIHKRINTNGFSD